MSLLDQDEIVKLVEVLKVVKKNKGTVYLFGNGGSHATAGHFANDLMKMCRIKAVCVGDMAAAMTAWGNDTGWENMYFGPLSEMVVWNDALIGISCSGNSANVVKALGGGINTWNVLAGALTGISNDNQISKMGLDAVIHTHGVTDIRVQEDIHMMVCHAVVRMLQETE
jgi:D-sedoheptulose 7-phosphate isomerase